jgi:lipid-A-disaccharide synthase-like uncharacterized protein
MNDQCDRPLTNAEVIYKILHEWFALLNKLMLLVFKSKLQSTFFVMCSSCGLFLFLAKISISDCLEGAKWLISLL